MNKLLYYYIRVLIREGHIAQYQNANGTANPPKYFFNFAQYLFLGISAAYVFLFRKGLNNDIVDYILSALSIMTALFMSLIVIVLDKLKSMQFKDENGESNILHLQTWHYIHQFGSITSYATLLALLLICILVSSLLFGAETDLNEYCFVAFEDINAESVLTFVSNVYICLVRFVFCYFLLDFLLMTLYAVVLIFQSIFNDLKGCKPNVTVHREEKIETTIEEEFSMRSFKIVIGMIVAFVLLVANYLYLHY